PCIGGESSSAICIPHARTNGVSAMVMSVGQSRPGIAFPESQGKIHYIFTIGVPVALAADYLRIVGALARIFRDKGAEKELRQAKKGEDFVAILARREMKL